MTGGGWLVAGCLVAAVLVVTGAADRRLLLLSRLGSIVSTAGRGARRSPVGASDGAAVVSELATLLRAGLPPGRAWSAVASSAQGDDALEGALVTAAAEASSGGDVAAALRRAPAADPVTARLLRSLAAAWHVASSTGAPMAGVLERLATSLREDADLADTRATAMAAPRATMRVLVALPLVGLVLGQLVGAQPLQVLVGTGPGRVCAVTGGVLSLAAWWWSRSLLRAAQRA